MTDSAAILILIFLGSNALAFYSGLKHGVSRSCDSCFRNGAQVGFKAGLIESQKLKVNVEIVEE